MGLLQDKLAKYDAPQQFMEKGVYPYFRTIDSHQDTEVLMSGKKVLMFGSNAYTGLTYDKRIIEAAKAATDKYGTGCAGSRFLNGTLDIHVELEKELAAFVGKEEALVYSTGFTVNEGVVSCLTDRNDYIICDDRDHASIVDGRRLSFSTCLKYKHNDMEALEKELQKCKPESVKLIVVDGVFSMEGDLANLPEIVRLKKKYNATIMVDEAHGLGVFGKQGRGVCDHFGVTEDIDLIMGTFSKSLASIGGFIAADKATINWLRHNSRSYIFSASNTPAATAAAREALHIIMNEPERQERLWNITNYALKSFRDAGFEIGETESPIIPLYVRDTEKTFIVTKMAFDEGIFINPVIPPACAPQDTLVRVALMATHTKDQVDYAVEKLTKCFKELGLIK
ncbi:aminotransferase class I/II-fold pyridoxal phosphate-dependent enzyme [Bacteroidaceae bacterium HV4-6-C5C]|jgi:7-keto-8-aminopelargonate synthetase and related enzymes|nr:aminotransferase class I/II-fold pyridoxal phosphate-dependent enzyme [Bacteroidaceae bacterium HV4-6-C5C]